MRPPHWVVGIAVVLGCGCGSVEDGTTVSRYGTVRLWDGATGDAVDGLALDALRSSPGRVDFIGDRTLTLTMGGGVLNVEMNE